MKRFLALGFSERLSGSTDGLSICMFNNGRVNNGSSSWNSAHNGHCCLLMRDQRANRHQCPTDPGTQTFQCGSGSGCRLHIDVSRPSRGSASDSKARVCTVNRGKPLIYQCCSGSCDIHHPSSDSCQHYSRYHTTQVALVALQQLVGPGDG